MTDQLTEGGSTYPACNNCGATLEPVKPGWAVKVLVRADGLHIAFYGAFRSFENLSGMFSWVEPDDVGTNLIPEGLFCPKGHIGLSHEGRITR